MMTLVALAILTSTAEAGANQAPYPPSSVIQSITWNYGEGGKQGIRAHDKFNLVKVTLRWNH